MTNGVNILYIAICISYEWMYDVSYGFYLVYCYKSAEFTCARKRRNIPMYRYFAVFYVQNSKAVLTVVLKVNSRLR